MALITLIFLSGLAAWIATSTIVEAEIFRDVREAVDRLHERKDNWLTYKLRYLISCHMCAGIWVAAIIAIWIPPLVSVPVIGWGLTALAIKGIAHSFLVAQKFLEGLTEMAKREEPKPEYVITVNPESVPRSQRSHIDEIRGQMAREKSNNVGWPE